MKAPAMVNDPRWPFRFQIVNQSEPNAFAIPGGGIYVSRGLLALVEREDELAGVLAHEIAHVTQRHSAKQQRKGILPGLLSLPGNVVGNVVGEDLGALINAPIDTVGGAWLSHYSRSQERWGENPDEGVFRKNQFLQPTIGFTLTFPEGWKHQNTPPPVCDFGASPTRGRPAAGHRRPGCGPGSHRAEVHREDDDQGPGRTGLDAPDLRG